MAALSSLKKTSNESQPAWHQAGDDEQFVAERPEAEAVNGDGIGRDEGERLQANRGAQALGAIGRMYGGLALG